MQHIFEDNYRVLAKGRKTHDALAGGKVEEEVEGKVHTFHSHASNSVLQ